MWCFIKNSELAELRWYKQQWDTLCKEKKKLENDLCIQNNLFSSLKTKIKGTKSVVYAVQKDRNGNNSFVCVQDKRKFRSITFKCDGELNIFVLSSIINPQRKPEKYHDMPYLEATFSGECITLHELHSDIDDEQYERLGYATMMLDTLLEIGKHARCTHVIGKLSSEDARTEVQKQKRNNFYRNYRTAVVELTFNDNRELEGSFRINL